MFETAGFQGMKHRFGATDVLALDANCICKIGVDAHEAALDTGLPDGIGSS